MKKEKNEERKEWEIHISFHEIKKLKILAAVAGSLLFILFTLSVFSIYYLEGEKQENELYRNQLKMADQKVKELEEKVENIEALGRELKNFVKPTGGNEKEGGVGGASTVPDREKEDRPPSETPGRLLNHIHSLDNRLNEELKALLTLRSDLLEGRGEGYSLIGHVKSHIPDQWPVVGPISSEYGYRVSPGGVGSTFHEGVDISGEYGTPIQATASGVVTKAGWEEGYGYLVEINHGEGYSTRYGHNSIVFAKEGENVEQGTIIALMGSTGNSTGTHCHYEVRIHGEAVNPIYFLPGAIKKEK